MSDRQTNADKTKELITAKPWLEAQDVAKAIGAKSGNSISSSMTQHGGVSFTEFRAARIQELVEFEKRMEKFAVEFQECITLLGSVPGTNEAMVKARRRLFRLNGSYFHNYEGSEDEKQKSS